MNRKKARRNARRRGFTLLEILLVVGLLALLASIAVPALMAQGEKGKIKMAEFAIASNGPIAQAIKLYRFEIGQLPEELMDLIEKPSGLPEEVEDKWTTKYLEDAKGLVDPWNREFEYKAPGTHHEDGFDLWSIGPDGIEGTDDDIPNWEDDR